jgi:hypothetical protein
VKVLFTWLAVVIATMGAAGPAAAYVGPGAGLSLVGAFWGLLVAIFAAVAFIVVWPVRRLLRRGRSAPDTATPKMAAPGTTAQPERRST